MPVTIPPGQPKQASSSMVPPPLPAERAMEEVEIDSGYDPFDARPADPDKPEGLIDRALARISSAYRDAQSHVDSIAARIRQALGWQKVPTITANPVVVSAPRNFKKKVLPTAFEKANRQALAKAQAEKAAAQSRVDFVQSVDAALTPEPMFADTDADAGDYAIYLKLCEKNGKLPGDMICPQNFLPGVQRHAKAFIELVNQRRNSAMAAKAEFTLSSSDQKKLAILAKFLVLSDDATDKNIGTQALKAAPAQTVTTTQLTSFMQWRDWKNKGYDKGQPAPTIDFDGARVYAKTLLEQYKGADRQHNSELNGMLLDAENMLEHPEMYKTLQDAANSSGPGPTMSQAASATEMSMPSSDPASTSKPAPAPPAPRIPAQPGQAQFSVGQQLGLRPVSELSMDDIAHATILFNEFTQKFKQTPDGIKLDRDSPYLYPECVAVANDFAERIANARDMTLSDEQLSKFQAALALRQIYAGYHRSDLDT
ncbi:MAG: hypothetical protein RL404_2192 [Pseudomonadota bacterium]